MPCTAETIAARLFLFYPLTDNLQYFARPMTNSAIKEYSPSELVFANMYGGRLSTQTSNGTSGRAMLAKSDSSLGSTFLLPFRLQLHSLLEFTWMSCLCPALAPIITLSRPEIPSQVILNSACYARKQPQPL